jgi:hypothetical protein
MTWPTPRLLILLLPLVSSACFPEPQSLEVGEVCKDIGYSIASRTFACTGDSRLANARYRRFEDALECTRSTAEAQDAQFSYRCPVAIEALDCPTVLSFGEDFTKWLGVAAECAMIVGPNFGADS